MVAVLPKFHNPSFLQCRGASIGSSTFSPGQEVLHHLLAPFSPQQTQRLYPISSPIIASTSIHISIPVFSNPWNNQLPTLNHQTTLQAHHTDLLSPSTLQHINALTHQRINASSLSLHPPPICRPPSAPSPAPPSPTTLLPRTASTLYRIPFPTSAPSRPPLPISVATHHPNLLSPKTHHHHHPIRLVSKTAQQRQRRTETRERNADILWKLTKTTCLLGVTGTWLGHVLFSTARVRV